MTFQPHQNEDATLKPLAADTPRDCVEPKACAWPKCNCLPGVTVSGGREPDEPGFVTFDLPSAAACVLPVGAQVQPNGAPVCEDCDTVHFCMSKGCVPKVPLPIPAREVQSKPDEWNEAQRICDVPAVDEAIRSLIDDPTGDNATCVVRAVMRASGVQTPEAPSIEGWLKQRRDYCLQQAKESLDGRIRAIWLRDVDTFDRALRDHTSGVGAVDHQGNGPSTADGSCQ